MRELNKQANRWAWVWVCNVQIKSLSRCTLPIYCILMGHTCTQSHAHSLTHTFNPLPSDCVSNEREIDTKHSDWKINKCSQSNWQQAITWRNGAGGGGDGSERVWTRNGHHHQHSHNQHWNSTNSNSSRNWIENFVTHFFFNHRTDTDTDTDDDNWCNDSILFNSFSIHWFPIVNEEKIHFFPPSNDENKPPPTKSHRTNNN